MRKVHKKQSSGRCYNFVDGQGYQHYTKGNKVHHTSMQRLSDATLGLYTFLSSACPSLKQLVSTTNDKVESEESKEETVNE